MSLPPRLTDEEIDALVDESLEKSMITETHVIRPMFQLLSIDPGYENNPTGYWSQDIAYWYADDSCSPADLWAMET